MQRTQNFQCKLRYRWSSRWLRTTEGAKATDDEDDDEDDDDDNDNVAHRWHRLDGIITDLVIISTD